MTDCAASDRRSRPLPGPEQRKRRKRRTAQQRMQWHKQHFRRVGLTAATKRLARQTAQRAWYAKECPVRRLGGRTLPASVDEPPAATGHRE